MPGVKAVHIIQDVGSEVRWAGDDIVVVAAADETTATDEWFAKCVGLAGRENGMEQKGLCGRNDGKTEMRKPIQDEFTRLPISRQRKYQLRMQRDRRCSECGEPAAQGSRCLKHLVKARERQRKKRGLKRRYYNTLSYKLQAVA